MPISAPGWDATFSTAELAQLAQVDPGVLSFWLRNDLLHPIGRRNGRGVHRRFDRLQVTVAALLSEMHRYGVNISALKSFSELIQRGVAYAMIEKPQPYVLNDATRLRSALDRYDAGEVVLIHKRNEETLEFSRTDASCRQDVIEEYRSDYVQSDELLRLAETIDPRDYHVIDMVDDILSELDAANPGDTVWLLWQDSSGWQVSTAIDSIEFSKSPSVRSGIYLGVSTILRATWSIDVVSRKKAYEEVRWNYVSNLPGERGERLRKLWARSQSDE